MHLACITVRKDPNVAREEQDIAPGSTNVCVTRGCVTKLICWQQTRAFYVEVGGLWSV